LQIFDAARDFGCCVETQACVAGAMRCSGNLVSCVVTLDRF
jgi:hypothetical protein